MRLMRRGVMLCVLAVSSGSTPVADNRSPRWTVPCAVSGGLYPAPWSSSGAGTRSLYTKGTAVTPGIRRPRARPRLDALGYRVDHQGSSYGCYCSSPGRSGALGAGRSRRRYLPSSRADSRIGHGRMLLDHTSGLQSYVPIYQRSWRLMPAPPICSTPSRSCGHPAILPNTAI
jgi:hypothetical protein